MRSSLTAGLLQPGFRNRCTDEVFVPNEGMHILAEGMRESEWEEGFVTSDGEFLNRGEAARRAMPTRRAQERAKKLNIDTEELESGDYRYGVERGVLKGLGATTEPPLAARWPDGITTAGFAVGHDGAQVDGHPVAWLAVNAWYVRGGSGVTVGWAPGAFFPLGTVPFSAAAKLSEVRWSPGRFKVRTGDGKREYEVTIHPDELAEFNVWLDKLEDRGIS